MLDQNIIKTFNEKQLPRHKTNFDHLEERLSQKGLDLETVVDQLGAFRSPFPVGHWELEGLVLVDFPMVANPLVWRKKSKM